MVAPTQLVRQGEASECLAHRPQPGHNAAMNRRQFIRHSSILAAAVASQGLVQSSALPAAETGRKLKAGMIGTAHSHAAGKMEALRRLTGMYEVVGVAEADEARRKGLAARKEYAGLPQLTEEQLLNVAGLDVVFVETDVPDLVPTAMRAAAAGVHIHLEKPAGPSMPPFRELLDRCGQKKRLIQMGYMFRGNPAFQLCFQAAREGWLGRIDEVHGVMGKVVGAAERKAVARFSGGMMFELGAHLIDAMVAVLGKPAQVHAHLRRTRPQQDDLADNTLAVCEYPAALATIRSSANDVEGFARRQFVISGDQGTMTILPLDSPKLTLTLAQPRGQWKKGTQAVTLRPMPGRYDDQLADFARIIRGEKDLDYTPEHDLAVHETLLKASGMM